MASRDIKLENILLDCSQRPLVKLCDFGYSKVCRQSPGVCSHNVQRTQHEWLDSDPGSKVGTISYLAPEVVQAEDSTKYDAKQVDVWSCGVVLYVMLAGV